MAKDDPAASGKDTQVYAVLRDAGIKRKKAKRIAAAIAAAASQATTESAPTKRAATKSASAKSATKSASTKRAATKSATKKSAKSSSGYENRTRAELLARAKTVGIRGRSKMTRNELIRALRAS